MNDPKVQEIEDLVLACHIPADQNVISDGFGHVTIRASHDSNRLLMSRSPAAGMVTAEDIMEFDLDCNPIDQRGRKVFGERFIHGEIYKVRPDVQAIVHSHTLSVIPFGVTKVPLRPVFHMSGFLMRQASLFEIREAAGEATNMLIENTERGVALARALGSAPVILMRGHGMVVVGNSIKQAVFRAIYTDVNAQIQSEAAQLGEITFLNEIEVANTAVAQDANLERPWEIWKYRVLCRQGKA
ncbi:MAG: class II aldolase/adducin family protein [Chloroflexi bacterium]|nr:class II aldolase/adducin family protein [Chloroflexota bacterium]